jgi:hypothetical protein
VADLIIDELDDYSRFAVPLILARFPEWTRFAHSSMETSAVEFEIPSPSPALESGLWLSTAGEELTIGFHTHHTHFTDYQNRFSPRPIEDGLNYVADILDEKLGVASWYSGDRLVCSVSVLLPCDEPLLGSHDDKGVAPLLNEMYSRSDRATLRSWFGRFDRDESPG